MRRYGVVYWAVSQNRFSVMKQTHNSSALDHRSHEVF
jgi:hypothetical protein